MRTRLENLPEFPDRFRVIPAAQGTRIMMKYNLEYLWEGIEPGQIWDPLPGHLCQPVKVEDVDGMILVSQVDYPYLDPRWEYPTIFVGDYEPRHPRVKARYDLWRLNHDKNISGCLVYGLRSSLIKPVHLREKVEETRRRLRLSKR